MNEMKSNRYTQLFVLFVGLILVSCYDKNNTIHRLPDLQITNISAGAVKTGDELKLHPIDVGKRRGGVYVSMVPLSWKSAGIDPRGTGFGVESGYN